MPGRGCAIGDFNNDGTLDVLVNCTNDVPQLLRCDSRLKNNWIKIETVGVKSNRSGIGARIYCITGSHRQMDDVRAAPHIFHRAICGFTLAWAQKKRLTWRSIGQVELSTSYGVSRQIRW